MLRFEKSYVRSLFMYRKIDTCREYGQFDDEKDYQYAFNVI